MFATAKSVFAADSFEIDTLSEKDTIKAGEEITSSNIKAGTNANTTGTAAATATFTYTN